jgi:hypothetical protein
MSKDVKVVAVQEEVAGGNNAPKNSNPKLEYKQNGASNNARLNRETIVQDAIEAEEKQKRKADKRRLQKLRKAGRLKESEESGRTSSTNIEVGSRMLKSEIEQDVIEEEACEAESEDLGAVNQEDHRAQYKVLAGENVDESHKSSHKVGLDKSSGFVEVSLQDVPLKEVVVIESVLDLEGLENSAASAEVKRPGAKVNGQVESVGVPKKQPRLRKKQDVSVDVAASLFPKDSKKKESKTIFRGDMPLFTLGVDEEYPLAHHVPHSITVVGDDGQHYVELAANPHEHAAEYRRTVVKELSRVLPTARVVVDLFASSRDVALIGNNKNDTTIYYFVYASIDSKDFLNRSQGVAEKEEVFQKTNGRVNIVNIPSCEALIEFLIHVSPSVIYMNDIYRVFELSVEVFYRILVSRFNRPIPKGNYSLVERIIASNEGGFPLIIWAGNLFPTRYGRFGQDGTFFEKSDGKIVCQPHAHASPGDCYSHYRAFSLTCQIKAMQYNAVFGSILFFPHESLGSETIETIAHKERIYSGFGVGGYPNVNVARFNRASALVQVRQGMTPSLVYNSVASALRISQGVDKVLNEVLAIGDTDNLLETADKEITSLLYDQIKSKDEILAQQVPGVTEMDKTWKTWLSKHAGVLGVIAGVGTSLIAIKTIAGKLFAPAMITVGLLTGNLWIDAFLVIFTAVSEEMVKLGLAAFIRSSLRRLAEHTFEDKEAFDMLFKMVDTSEVSISWYLSNLVWAILEAVVYIIQGRWWFIPIMNHFSFAVLRSYFGPWAPILGHLMFNLMTILQTFTGLPCIMVYFAMVFYGVYLDMVAPDHVRFLRYEVDLKEVCNVGKVKLQQFVEDAIDVFKRTFRSVTENEGDGVLVAEREKQIVPLVPFVNDNGENSVTSFQRRFGYWVDEIEGDHFSQKAVTRLFEVPRGLRLFAVPGDDLAKAIAIESRVFEYSGLRVLPKALNGDVDQYVQIILETLKMRHFGYAKEDLCMMSTPDFLNLTLSKLKPQRRGLYESFINGASSTELEELRTFQIPPSAELKRTMFIKANERLPINAKTGGVKPRTIICCPPWLNLMYAPHLDAFHKKLKMGPISFGEGDDTIFGIYAAGLSVDALVVQINEVMRTGYPFFIVAGDDLFLAFNMGGRYLFVEGDATAFDATQGQALLDIEMEIYRLAGMGIEPLKKMTYSPIEIQMSKNKLSFAVVCRSSGFPNTTVGNSLIQGMAAYYCLRHLSLAQRTDLSDGFLENIKTCVSLRFLAFGIRLKVPVASVDIEAVSFLRGFFYQDDVRGGVRWAPALGRLVKLQSTFADLAKLYPGETDLSRVFLSDVLFSMKDMDWPESFTIFDGLRTYGQVETIREQGYLPGYFSEMLDGERLRYSSDVVVRRYGRQVVMPSLEDLLCGRVPDEDLQLIYSKDYA